MPSGFFSLKDGARKIVKQTQLLFSAQIGVILLGIITVPIISRTLGPAHYGEYALVLAIIAFSASFFEFGFFSAGARLLATSKGQEEESEVLGSLYVIAAVIGFLFGLTMWIVSFYIDTWLSSSIGPILRLIAPLAIFYPVQFMIQQIAQGSNRVKQLAAITILPGLWALIAVLTLSHKAALTVTSALLINLLGLVLVSIGILTIFRPSWRNMRKNMAILFSHTRSYGRDVYLGRVVGSAMFDLDKFFIARFVSATSVGFYSLAILAVSPMVILSQSFATALFKDFASQERISPKVTFANALWLVGSALVISLIGPPLIILVFSEQFRPVIGLLFPLAVAAIFQGLYQPYNNFLGAHGQGKYLRNIALIFALASGVFNFIFVRYYGAMGAAVATLISNSTYFILCLYCYRLFLRQNPAVPTMAKSLPEKEFFEHLYKTDPEPWGLDTRASQLVRYQDYLAILTPYLQKKDTVLDIGCGKGQISRLLAPHVRHVSGIDISEEAITQAKNNTAEKNIDYAVGTLPKLDFPKQGFSLTAALEVLYYLDDAQRHIAIQEMVRVTKPQGLLFLSVNIGPKPYFSMDELRDLLATYAEVLLVQPTHGKIYSFWENKILILKDTPLRNVATTILRWHTPVRIARFLSRVCYGDKGITMASILVRTK